MRILLYNIIPGLPRKLVKILREMTIYRRGVIEEEKNGQLVET